MCRWSAAGFHSQHFWHMLTNATTHLYRGNAAAALARVESQWEALSRSMLLRVQVARVESYDLRGRCALALARTAGAPERRRLQSLVAADLRRLDREGTPAARAQARLLAAGLGILSDDGAAATAGLEAARRGFEAAGMALHAAVVRRRLAELRGIPDPDADRWFASQGVRDPTRVTATLAPGF
jgi:hypothetical protein